jgi:uncharacterized damage-inducible protein DinB
LSINNYIQTMIEYNYALYDRVWESIMQLREEQFVQEADYAHGSVRNQMVHVAMIDTRWRRGLQGDPDARFITFEPADYPNRAAVRALWDESAQAMLGYVAGLEEQQLEAAVPGMDEPAWKVLAHVVNHGTDHRAQILRLLHDLGAPTFSQDFMIYLWERG